jgi:hypothetical protein
MARRHLLLLITAIVFTTWLPYIFGWWLTPPETRYLWLIYNPDDQNVHLMWARQAMEGKLFFHDLFTTEPHPGLFTNLFSLLLGWFCRLTGISLHFGYQVFRTLIAVAFLLTAHWLSGFLLSDRRSRLFALLLVGFSSGFGWVLVLFWWLTGQRPPFFFVDVSPELTMPEANSFLSMTVAPLAALGVTLVMGALGCLLTSMEFKPKNASLAPRPLSPALLRFVAFSVLFGMLVVNVHTYAAVPMLIAVFLWQAFQVVTVRRVNLRELATVLLFAFPVTLLLGGQAFLFSRDPAFAQKAATPTLTPSPVILIGSYGFIALGAVLGLPAAWRKAKSGEKGWALLLAWTTAIIVSIYLPVSFQRKMIEGLHVALCFLTALAFEEWMKRFGEKQRRDEGHGTRDEARGAKSQRTDLKGQFAAQTQSRISSTRPLSPAPCPTWSILAFIVLTAPSQIAFFALNGYWLVHNNLIYDTRFNPPYSRMLMPPYYLSENHLRLFNWLEQNARPDEAVLCHPMLGNYLPVLTGRKVFVGHWAETLNFVEKLRVATAVWRGLIPVEEARGLFRRHRIRYALETDFERLAAGGSTNLHRYGEVVFQAGRDLIFRLKW